MVHGLGGGVRRVWRLMMVVCVRYRKTSWWLKDLCVCGVWICGFGHVCLSYKVYCQIIHYKIDM